MQIFLQAPFLSVDDAAVAEAAHRHLLPVWILGRASWGAYRLARALHRDGEPEGFVSVRTRLDSPAELLERLGRAGRDIASGRISLYVQDLDRQPSAVQERLLGLFDEAMPDLRLLAHTEQMSHRVLHDLRLRLEPFILTLRPLGKDRNERAPLIRSLSERQSRELGLGSSPLGEEDVASIAAEAGDDLDALEAAVRSRIVFRLREGVVDWRSPATREAAPSALPHETSQLAWLIAEVAHELKNPMVTLRTFATSMERIVSDVASRERFHELASEAIERMDGFLEELLGFSRLAAPRPRLVDVRTALERALPEARDRIDSRGLVAADGCRVFVDEEHLDQALRLFVRGVLRKLPDGERIVIRWRPPASLIVQTGKIGLSPKLHGMLVDTPSDNDGLPLEVLLARAIIERNGGTVLTVPERDRFELRLTLPPSGTTG